VYFLFKNKKTPVSNDLHLRARRVKAIGVSTNTKSKTNIVLRSIEFIRWARKLVYLTINEKKEGESNAMSGRNTIPITRTFWVIFVRITPNTTIIMLNASIALNSFFIKSLNVIVRIFLKHYTQ